MTIEIKQPELEARLKQVLDSGAFRDLNEFLVKALDALELQSPTPLDSKPQKQSLAQFLLESPLRGSGLRIERQKDYPQSVKL